MSPSTPDPQYQQLLELLSAQQDGQLTAAEQQVLQQLSAQYPQQARQFQDALQALSTDLRRLPRRPLPGPIFSAQAENQVPWLVQRTDARGRRWARLTAIVSVLTLAVLLVMFTRNGSDRGDGVLVANLDPSRQADSEAATMPADSSAGSGPAALLESADAAPAAAAPPAVSAPAMVMADPPLVAAAAPAPQVDRRQVELLADTVDWKVVLVQVGAVDRSDVKERVGKVLQQHGLLLADTAPVQMPEWLGVVLSGDALLQQSLIQAVSVAVGGQASEWNPGQILSASREEIIAAVRRSLSSPTQAELARGEIYVAVRDDVSAVAEAGASPLARAAANRVDFYNGLNGAEGTAAAGKGQTAATATPAPGAAGVVAGAGASVPGVPAEAPSPKVSPGQVTLFVFQFADAADDSSGPDQQLPGKVRNIF